MSTSFLNSRTYQYSDAKAYVFSDSVLCLGKMGDDPTATWKSKIKWSSENNHVKDLNRIDGMPTEFESALWVKIILNLGSEYLMERSNMWSIQITTIQKSLQIHMKVKRHEQVSRLLQPDQKKKQNHKRGNLLIHQVSYRCTKENGLTLSHQHQNLAAYEVSKKVISLLRHSQTVQREDDGAIHFWRIKLHLRNQFSQVQHWSDERYKSCLAAGGGSKKRYQYCSDNSGTILYLRALQGHSGNNLIDPMVQDNVVIGTGIFPYIYHVGCTFNLHSVINNGLILGGQNLSRRQTVFFLPIDQEVESSNYSGRLSHVSSQPAIIPSSRSMQPFQLHLLH